MWRIIPVTFAFLAFALYDLSGGTEFDPPEIQSWQTAILQQPEPLTPQFSSDLEVTASSALIPNTPVTPTAQPEIVKQVLPLVSLDKITESFVSVTNAANLDAASLVPGLPAWATDAATKIDLPSQLPTDPLDPPADLREITGLRVNMRDGPGAEYPVLRRLNLGQEVEVLDRASGWYRLKSLQSGQIGWVSASLVSDAAN